MTIRTRTRVLTTGPGEKLRKLLWLRPSQSGSCAQLARAMNQHKTEATRKPERKMSGWAGRGPDQVKLDAIQIRIAGLVNSLGKGYAVDYQKDGTPFVIAPDGFRCYV